MAAAPPHRPSPRAVLLGLLGVVCLSWGTPYSDLVLRGTWVGLTAFPIGAFTALLLLLLLNAPWRAAGRGLRRAELLTVYAMLLVAAGLSSFGLVGLLVPYAAGPAYFATPENHFAETVLRHLPHWLLLPADLSQALYEGLPPGRQVPWDCWLRPAVGWGLLVAGVYALLIASTAALRRPWIAEERLTFPLVELPCQLATDGAGPWPELLRSRVLWAGFAVPFLVHAINGLHYHFPALPAINIHRIDLGPYLSGRVGEAVQPLWLRVLFTVIGLTYLLPSEIGLSLWVFFGFFLAQAAGGALAGATMPFVQAYPVRRFVALQMIGGVIAAGGSLVSRAGRALAASRRAGPEPGAPRRAELWVLAAVGAGLLALWAHLVGLGVGWAALLVVPFLLFQVVGTRLVAEAGMLYVQHPARPLNLLLSGLGTAASGPPRLPAMVLLDHLFMLDNRSPLQPALLQGWKLAEVAGVSARGLLGAMSLALLVAGPVALLSTLGLLLRHGGTMLNPWFTSYYTNNLFCSWSAHLVLNGEPARPGDLLWVLLGAVTMGGLTSLHRRLGWWPLHPLGYLMGASWPMINFWFAVLLGWLLKVVTLKLGGARAYRRLLPAALGLILGEYAAAGLWTLLDALAGVRGHEIFSF
ncbi:MAG: hypothetical protein IT204_02390 [Fimbriimonadaceae bacterium]|nr:hypothetical protein [Fimbriimonadaceae bacterium]